MTMIPPTQIGSTSCRRPRGTLYLLVAVTALVLPMIARPAERQPELLIRTDDIGMNNSVNTALGKFIAMGVPFSASVMVACPWFPEAAEILRDNPQVSVGIHLTLNSEWKDYRWGPVLGASRVPTLVDSDGYFFATGARLLDNGMDLGQVEAELRAQIERARHAGLKVDYLVHLGLETPEMNALVDANNPADPYRVAKHRQAELDAVTSPAFFRELAGRGVHFVTYRDMVARYGRAAMKAPENFEYSMNEPGDR
jgi:predicted glycoside hydrolase/deacetylase ChbG (UPF0249 family)